ncbi:hypothetical protein HO173_003575 [Letharia columbiana]|uniref:Uncharacterized protein n=1 Tax=Letharia columbiana TaxID=112416 RepID=A0A8H6L7G0_9LECA|nr:uncharacterized protein HO173_003575 [Letharia columbiana]KAF6238295.1 hypothetical protein HO173_003575 [Letharia columbiana]
MTSDHYQLARGRVSRRMDLGKERVDFMTPVFRQGVRAVGGNTNDGGGQGQRGHDCGGSRVDPFHCSSFAGTETVGTTRAGITPHLVHFAHGPAHPCNRISAPRSPPRIRASPSPAVTDLAYLDAVRPRGPSASATPSPRASAATPPRRRSRPRCLPPPAGTPVSGPSVVHQQTTQPTLLHPGSLFVPERWLPREFDDGSGGGDGE